MSQFAAVILLLGSLMAGAEPPPAFSFHLFNEPNQLDPQLTNSASGSYLITNIFRGLYRFRSDKGLVPDMAKKCERGPSVLRCTLKKQIFWSNGDPVTSEDFVRAFRNLLNPAGKNQSADLLFTLKNARDVWAGKLPPEKLGVIAEDSSHLRFEFAENDLEFEYKLLHPALNPRHATNSYDPKEAASLIVNGPYRIASWREGHQIKLVTNKYYDSQVRPDLEIYFVDNDNTALRLYEAGKLTFLRRLVAAEIPRFKNKPDFHQFPMARFDYIGFGPALKDLPQLRQALSESVNFSSFHELFDSKGLPGCPSLPRAWLDRTPCEKMNLLQAKKLAGESAKIPLQFGISQLGGEDISRQAEWFQGQWSKNLTIKVPIRSMEQVAYIQQLKNNPPPVFRKGVGLDRPTCAAALEIFTEGNAENYIRLRDSEYNRIYQELLKASSPVKKKVLCRQAVERLLAGHWIIPLGEMHFTVLANPRFKGWHVNEINQLDLTDLRLVQ